MGYKTSENDYKVYMHKNPFNGKVYIGCTKKPLSCRFDNGNGYKRCLRFWDDIVRYGFDNFEHILIKDGMKKREALDLEEKLIREYRATDPAYGYNMRGGGVGNIPTKETCRHISMAKMGHEVSKETREKLKQYGNKKVVQLALDGSFVAEFPSVTSAAESVGINKTNISLVCRHHGHTSRGYKWKFKEEWEVSIHTH